MPSPVTLAEVLSRVPTREAASQDRTPWSSTWTAASAWLGTTIEFGAVVSLGARKP
jgi:hypothetical protein